jgi:hypothetical protein
MPELIFKSPEAPTTREYHDFKTTYFFSQQLPHLSFPPAALVLCHTTVLGTPSCKPSALATEYVHRLLLGPIPHVTVHKSIHQESSRTQLKHHICGLSN